MTLSPEQERIFEDALDCLRQGLNRALENVDDKVVELDQSKMGRVSRIDAIQQQQMSAAGRRAQTLRLRQVRAAMERMVAGTYGECLNCEESIGAPRLTARPEAPFCLDCQSRRER